MLYGPGAKKLENLCCTGLVTRAIKGLIMLSWILATFPNKCVYSLLSGPVIPWLTYYGRGMRIREISRTSWGEEKRWYLWLVAGCLPWSGKETWKEVLKLKKWWEVFYLEKVWRKGVKKKYTAPQINHQNATLGPNSNRAASIASIKQISNIRSFRWGVMENFTIFFCPGAYERTADRCIAVTKIHEV